MDGNTARMQFTTQGFTVALDSKFGRGITGAIRNADCSEKEEQLTA